MEYIPAKTILQKVKYGDNWFGIDYNMNLYKGCSHGCIYCDSRSDCYAIENFDRVRGKENSGSILEAELLKKKAKGIIGIGSMSDPYNPLEKEYRITRQALMLIEKYGFGVSLETKSSFITRDIDLFKAIAKKAPVILKMTVTTADDTLASMIEPQVNRSSERFEAIKKLSSAGLFVGVLLTPILPFLTDQEENIKSVIQLASRSGAKFVYSMGSVTLRDRQREYFYEKLDQHFPGLKKKYIQTYGNQYSCYSTNPKLNTVFEEECRSQGLVYKMKDIIQMYQKDKKVEIEQLRFL